MQQRIIIFLTFFLFSGVSYGQKSFWPTDNARFDSLSLLIEQTYHEKTLQQRKEIIASMYAIAKETNNRTLLSYATYWNARNTFLQDIDSAAVLIDKGIDLIDSLINPYAYNHFLLLKATLLTEENDYVEAYRIYEKAIPFFEDLKDTLSLAGLYMNKGVLMYNIGFYEEALALYLKANDYFEMNGYYVSMIRNNLNIYNIKLEQDEGMAAYRELELLIEDPLIQHDTIFLISSMLTLYTNSPGDSVYFKYAQKAYDLANFINHSQLLNTSRINKANMHITKNESDSFLYYTKMVYDYSKEKHLLRELIIACHNLSFYYDKQQQPDSALYYMKEYMVYRDSAFSQEKISTIHKIQAQTAINNYQEQLRFAAEKAEFEKRRTRLTALLILSLAALICVILWYRWRKARTEKEHENRELNIQLDYKNRELTTRTLMLNEKNNTLREIKREVENLDLNGQLTRKDKQQLEERIDGHLQADDEWEFVRQHFESVHPGFFTRLKAIAPTLSEKDLHICVYIHIGMSAKEMARLLGVLPESINQARYRIRKKLGFGGDTSLEDFLRGV